MILLVVSCTQGQKFGSLDPCKNNSNKAKEWLFYKRVNGEVVFIPKVLLEEGRDERKPAHERVLTEFQKLSKAQICAYVSDKKLDIKEYALAKFAEYEKITDKRRVVFRKAGIKGGAPCVCKAPNRFSRSYQRKVKKSLGPLLYNRDYRRSVFLTLTLDPAKFSGLPNAWREITPQFNRFMTELFTRKLKRRIPYIAVVEAHKKGYPHIHILFLGVSRIMDWREIRNIWGLGHTWINRTYEGKKIKNPVAYMFKYITKTFTKTNEKNELTHALLWLFHRRSYLNSRNLVQPLNSLKNGVKGEYELVGLLLCSDKNLLVLSNNPGMFDILISCRG